MKFIPNEYLDARRPAWLEAEMFGAVRYDPASKLVEVSPARQDIAACVIHAREERRP